ncbi:MAG: hypothetical protein Q7S51_10220 [Gallionellaceae bacterium]|nr:hypothetical protein [Gallionellaceae bacterium]
MEGLLLLVFAFLCGVIFGAWSAWHFWLKKEKPVLNITVDRDVLSAASQQMVMDWLDQRGLTWQPKGAVFDLGKVKKP